jgi:hypothetical protein
LHVLLYFEKIAMNVGRAKKWILDQGKAIPGRLKDVPNNTRLDRKHYGTALKAVLPKEKYISRAEKMVNKGKLKLRATELLLGVPAKQRTQ